MGLVMDLIPLRLSHLVGGEFGRYPIEIAGTRGGACSYPFGPGGSNWGADCPEAALGGPIGENLAGYLFRAEEAGGRVTCQWSRDWMSANLT